MSTAKLKLTLSDLQTEFSKIYHTQPYAYYFAPGRINSSGNIQIITAVKSFPVPSALGLTLL